MMLAEAILSGPPSVAQCELFLDGESRAAVSLMAAAFLRDWAIIAAEPGIALLGPEAEMRVMISAAMGAGIFWGLRVGE